MDSWNPGRFVVTALLAACLCLCTAHAFADDWSRWGRTSSANMVSPETGLPSVFEPSAKAPEEAFSKKGGSPNIRWVAKLGSQTYGNASVSGGRVFVGTNNASPRLPYLVGDRGILMSFDAGDGSFQWQLSTPKLGSRRSNEWEQLGLCSSPTIEGDRLYVITNRAEVLCLDVKGMADGNQGPFVDEEKYRQVPGQKPAKVGGQEADILWRFDLRTELGVFPHNIAASNVLVVGDKVYVNTSNGQDWSHRSVPSPVAPALVALDKKTGKLLGEENAGISERLLHGSWSSPSYGEVGGKGMVFFGGGDGYCYGFEPEPSQHPDGFGELKEIWRVDANPANYRAVDGVPVPYHRRGGPSEIIATPVFHDNRVYSITGQDPSHGPGQGALTCINPTLKGDVSKSGKVWTFDGIGRSVSNVSIKDGLLFAADLSGKIYCLDALSGAQHWVHDSRAVTWSSPVIADGKVYIGNEDGDMLIFEASKTKKLIHTARFPAPIYSSVVVSDKALFITTQTHLYKIQETPEQAP